MKNSCWGACTWGIIQYFVDICICDDSNTVSCKDSIEKHLLTTQISFCSFLIQPLFEILTGILTVDEGVLF